MSRVTARVCLGGPPGIPEYARGHWVYGDGNLDEAAAEAIGVIFTQWPSDEDLCWGFLLAREWEQDKRWATCVYRRSGVITGTSPSFRQVFDAGEEGTWDHDTCKIVSWRKYFADSYTDDQGVTVTSDWEKTLTTSNTNSRAGAVQGCYLGSVADAQNGITAGTLTGSAKATMDASESSAVLRIQINVTGTYNLTADVTYTLRFATPKTFEQAVNEARTICDSIPMDPDNIDAFDVEWNVGAWEGMTEPLDWMREAFLYWEGFSEPVKRFAKEKRGITTPQLQVPTFERTIILGGPLRSNGPDFPPYVNERTMVTESRLLADDGGKSIYGKKNCLVRRENADPKPNSCYACSDSVQPNATGNERCYPKFGEHLFYIDWDKYIDFDNPVGESGNYTFKDFDWGVATIYWRCGYENLPDPYQRLCAWDGTFTFDRTNQSFDTTGHTFDEQVI